MKGIGIREAADELGVSHKVIRRLIAQGALEAVKRPGAHGTEWRVEVASLEAYRSGVAPTRSRVTHVRTSALPPGNSGPGGDHRDDICFLRTQVESLTRLLQQTLPTPAAPSAPPVLDVPPAAPLVSDVTAALQASLRVVGPETIQSVELCSTKLLWGKPVLWRLVASEAQDVAALLEAVLKPTAQWDPPAAEIVFLWAFDATGTVVWGTPCGPDWFGPAFQDALRNARVERR